MSSDNGIYIASFPTENGPEYRVAHAFDSCIIELDSHWMTPEQARDYIVSVFGTAPFSTEHEAMTEAMMLDDDIYTEYGICRISFEHPFGSLREDIPEPELSPQACPHCSTAGVNETWHSNHDECTRNPNSPQHILVTAFRDEGFNGINEHYIARIAVEALREKGLIQ
jgi:hypothetical protein